MECELVHLTRLRGLSPRLIASCRPRSPRNLSGRCQKLRSFAADCAMHLTSSLVADLSAMALLRAYAYFAPDPGSHLDATHFAYRACASSTSALSNPR